MLYLVRIDRFGKTPDVKVYELLKDAQERFEAAEYLVSTYDCPSAAWFSIELDEVRAAVAAVEAGDVKTVELLGTARPLHEKIKIEL